MADDTRRGNSRRIGVSHRGHSAFAAEIGKPVLDRAVGLVTCRLRQIGFWVIVLCILLVWRPAQMLKAAGGAS